MKRTLVLTFAVAAILLVAGCTGGDTGGDGTTAVMDGTTTAADDATPTTDGTATATDGTTTRTPGGDDDGDGDGAVPQYSHFQFREGDRYVYEMTAGGVEGTLRWEVTDVTGDRVTVHLEGQLGARFEETVTGTRDNIRQKLMGSQYGELITSGLLSPYDSLLRGHALEVGNSWSGTTSEGSGTVTIIGTDSYAGVDCYVAEIQVNGVTRYTACLSPRLGLVVHSTVTPDGQTVSQEFTLVAYSAGGGNGAGDDAGDDDGDGDGAALQYTHLDFQEGERYEYDVVMGGTQGEFLWEVTAVSGDQLTVHTRYQIGTVTFERTVTGTRATIETELEATTAGSFVNLGVFHPYYDHYHGHRLEVGNSWSATTTQGSASYTVTGTDSYAGVDCYTTEVRVNGVLRHEGCLSPELGLVVHSVVYNGIGTRSMEMTLSEYSSG